jgi:hypothetical protein
MAAPGCLKADIRHLHLHRVALDKLRVEPARRAACIALVDRWLASPEQVSSRPWLEEWRRMLVEWPIERIANSVLDFEGGQILRRCSPLGPVLTPRERWAALAQVERDLEHPGADGP